MPSPVFHCNKEDNRMNYCGQYSNNINMTAFQEISIIYERQDAELIHFLQEHSQQRVILIIKDIDDFRQAEEWIKLNAIHDKFPEWNLAVCFNEVGSFREVSETLQLCMNNLKIPFFTGYLATNFDQLNYLCSLGVSDIYIGEDICFDLQRVKLICNKHNVKVRTFPNVGQCSVKAGPALKKFFIRPEDVEEYSDVIDVLEFWGPLNRQETLLKIYNKGVWYGDLKDLLLDFNLSFDSRRIIPGFARIRKSCGRKCMKGEFCTICDKIYNISEKLADNNIIIKQ